MVTRIERAIASATAKHSDRGKPCASDAFVADHLLGVGQQQTGDTDQSDQRDVHLSRLSNAQRPAGRRAVFHPVAIETSKTSPTWICSLDADGCAKRLRSIL
jgi:hypothetical protein